MVCGTNHGSRVCAGQFLDCANPCFAHNIYYICVIKSFLQETAISSTCSSLLLADLLSDRTNFYSQNCCSYPYLLSNLLVRVNLPSHIVHTESSMRYYVYNTKTEVTVSSEVLTVSTSYFPYIKTHLFYTCRPNLLFGSPPFETCKRRYP